MAITLATENTAPSKSTQWKRIEPREIAIWCLLAMLLSCAVSRFRPGLYNDSFQYLSTAQNLAHGRGLATSLVYFDTERNSGRMPAPLTTFAPGFPVVLAGLDRLGVSLERGGFLVSLAALMGVIPLICWAGRMMDLPTNAVRVALLAFIGNSATSLEATMVATEALFMLCGFAAIVLLMSFLQDRTRVSQLAAGSVLLGVSVWIRYAGLFLFLAVLIFLLVRLIMIRDNASTRAVIWLFVPAAMLAGLFARNAAISGSWKGGNTKVVNLGWKTGIGKMMSGLGHLLLGDGRPGAVHLLFLMGIGLIALVLLYVTLSSTRLPVRLSGAALLPAFCVTFYWVSILYMAMHSVISVNARMFYPFLPWMTLLASALLFWSLGQKMSAKWRWSLQAGIVAASISYAGLNAKDLLSPPAPSGLSPAERLAASGPDAPLLQWIHNHIPDKAVIAAEDGQATGYLLQHPIVTMVSLLYSDQHWGESDVRQLMERYGAEYLIVYPGLEPEIDPAPTTSGFLQALEQRQPPAWLRVAAENSKVRIYRYVRPD